MGLKINEKKTQILTISSARNENIAWIKHKDGSVMYSANELKLLGFVFNSKPNVNSQVDHIINKASCRSFVLRNLASQSSNKCKLKNVYCAVIRSVLVYSSVTFGPMLAQYQKNRIENIQKRCLRSIFGFDKAYPELLEESGLVTLEERRNNAIKKFAEKASRNPQFLHWFPKNVNRLSQRISKSYEEKFAKSDRLYFSPLYTMRRILNESPNTRTSNPEIVDLSHLFNQP